MILGKLDSYMQNNETEPLSHTLHKKSTQNGLKTWMLTPETIKYLEENKRGKFLATGLGDDFFLHGIKKKSNKKQK